MTCVSGDGAAITMHNVGGLAATQSTGIYPGMLATRAALAATWGDAAPASAAELRVYVAPEPGTPATAAAPHVIDLEALFD